eukprot:1872498-Pleurochrysis_carterae.AAC.1
MGLFPADDSNVLRLQYSTGFPSEKVEFNMSFVMCWRAKRGAAQTGASTRGGSREFRHARLVTKLWTSDGRGAWGSS